MLLSPSLCNQLVLTGSNIILDRVILHTTPWIAKVQLTEFTKLQEKGYNWGATVEETDVAERQMMVESTAALEGEGKFRREAAGTIGQK